jgi:hypothetical protein
LYVSEVVVGVEADTFIGVIGITGIIGGFESEAVAECLFGGGGGGGGFGLDDELGVEGLLSLSLFIESLRGGGGGGGG